MQVNLDEPLCAAALRRYATRLAGFRHQKKPVRLGMRIPSDEPPRSPGELAQLEAAHNVCDLYLWLACRFPREFTDVPAAEECAKRAQALIAEGIRLLGVAALRAGQRQRQGSGRQKKKGRRREATEDSDGDDWESTSDNHRNNRNHSKRRGGRR